MDFSTFFLLLALFLVMSLATFYVLSQGVTSVLRWGVHDGGVSSMEHKALAIWGRGRGVLARLGQWAISRIERWSGISLSARPRAWALALTMLCKRAGFQDVLAVRVLVGSQVFGFIAAPALGLLGLSFFGESWGPWSWFLSVLALAIAGLYLPMVFVRWLAYRRQQEIVRSFPEALDLIMICVETGLGLDAAIQRVGDEFKTSCPPLYQEFRTFSLELRTGALRASAFQNLADRIDLQDIRNVVTTLTQADRLGTSLLEAVRVQAEQLRLHRRLMAEERAAKIGTKLLFPLIFFLFPAIFLVLVGPAVLSVIQNFPRVVSP
jgi:pilus assembly protein TadC